MVCGARLNINLWQAVAKEGRRRVEWTGQLSSLPAVWLSREEKCTGRLCSVPLKCDMRSLTYKLNVTTGGQFYFNRGDHRQATIHFPPFFLSPPLLRFLLFSPPPLLLLFPPLSLLLIRPGPTLSPILARSNRGLDRRSTTKIHRGSIIDHAPSIIPFPSSRPFVYGFLCGICGLRKARVVNSRCGENENIRSCSPIPTRFSLIPFVVVEVVRSSNKGFVGENEFPITRSRWKREKFEKFRRYAREKLSTLSLSSVLRSSSHDSRKWRSVGGNLPTWPESFLFFFSPPLLSSYPWVCCAKIVRPAAVFLRGISTGNVKLEDEENTRNEKKGHPSERERETLEDRTSSRMIPVCELAERKLTMRRYVIATFNRNHHVRMEKRKE